MTLSLEIIKRSIAKQIEYILCSQRWRIYTLWVEGKRGLGKDLHLTGSDHELLIAKVKVKVTQSCLTLCEFSRPEYWSG